MRTLLRLALTLGALIALGYFIASTSGNTTITPADEPGEPGKTPIQFALGFAIVLGWALLSRIEAVWKEDDESSEWWGPFAFAALPRLVVGLVVFAVVFFIASGFERLGVGLGAK